jgi:cation:H+ antiporter
MMELVGAGVLAPSVWPLSLSIGLFMLAVVVIIIGGQRITAVAEQLAVRTGLGEALVGALFLGATTSLPGLVTSVTAAAQGHAELAVSNALGGIVAQTAFLAIADMAYRKANLEHAAASEANMLQGTLLIILLTVPLLAMAGPEVSVGAIHPATPVLLCAYVFGLRLVSQAHKLPMWQPRHTPETETDVPEAKPMDRVRLGHVWSHFLVLAILIGTGGWVVARAGVSIAAHTGLSETLVGSYLTAVSTSFPELVVAITAVRRGALTLAVGDILGGNAFDTLLVALSDIFYRGGSIYHVLSEVQVIFIGLTILLTGILLMGLLRREKHGIGNIGLESFLVIVLYVGFSIFLFFNV